MTAVASVAPPISVTHQFQQTSRNVAVNTAAQRVVNKVMDIAEPIIDALLWPLRQLVAWFYNKFLATPPSMPQPRIISIRQPVLPPDLIIWTP